MVEQPDNKPARIYDFAAHRMQRLAQRRRASGATQRFLWGYPGVGVMQAVEFSARAKSWLVERPSEMTR
jgi:hypothetical protein